ncbi:uncharacterized protein LOC110603239 [Manihot esculenta]|uniref:uncharacterized protein LOC110603239 n=1 Tax=Manihot esculenta TaxID=3983 RepID=UPI000B5D148D|nr:uncharacterized protein LOC110603239 [Manihot esculenta]
MSQLATSLSKLESQEELSSRTIVNSRKNVSAVTLRSKKELLENPCEVSHGHDKSAELETESIVPKSDSKSTPTPASTELDTCIIKPSFPERLAKSKKEKEENEILERFHKVEKLVGYQKICVDENISVVFQRKLSTKCKDQSIFAIPIKIGNVGVRKAMCDLGASINIMSLSVFQSLNTGPLKETGVVIQLADYSIVYPKGVLEDVLVQVDNFIFPADFYVVPMEDNKSSNSSGILLGKLFLSTAKTKINVYDDILTMELDGEVIEFNIYDNAKYPSNISNVCRVDVSKPLVQQVLKLEYGNELNTKLCENFEKSS